jgi:hypothetical protein
MSSFYEGDGVGVEVLKIEELEFAVLCIDSTALLRHICNQIKLSIPKTWQ